MKIASHHLREKNPYHPVCAWPDDCYVQWGGEGIVIGDNPYRTAFFEAFPKDSAGGFIRGEAPTVTLAEMVAFGKYTKEVACDHRWGRQKYKNGGAICYKCGAFSTKIFKELHEFGEWRKPISADEENMLSYPNPFQPGEREYERSQKYRHKLELRRKVFGVDLSKSWGRDKIKEVVAAIKKTEAT